MPDGVADSKRRYASTGTSAGKDDIGTAGSGGIRNPAEC